MLLSEKLTKQSFKEFAKKKIIDPHFLSEVSERLKKEGKTLVTLNGSFDLLHPGHLEIIYRASCLGDSLFLLLNSDDSIRAYKIPQRPIVPLESRMFMVAALEFVDYVSWFDETTPCKILEKIQPNIHANGAEYGENCVEAEVVKKHGGRIEIIQLVEGFSTTALIKKIKDLCD